MSWGLTFIACALCLAAGLYFRHKRLILAEKNRAKLARIKHMFDTLEEVYRYPTGRHEWDPKPDDESEA